MAEPLLEVRGLSKRFCRNMRRSLAYSVRDIAQGLVPGGQVREGLRPDEFWALENVSFAIHAGEALAVVGPNGAGKSTLLKTVAGLINPDVGEVHLIAASSAVIELGSGLDPLLTGRENAELILAWHGIAKKRRDAMIENAALFSELGPMFDGVVLNYSTGMRARLAYSIAIQRPADVLILDEVLAVGDIAFQRKCLNGIRAHLDRGGALLFVSHNIFQIQTVCTHGIMLEEGRVTFAGSAVETIARQLSRAEATAPAYTSIGGDGFGVTGLAAAADGASLTTDRPAAFELDVVAGQGGSYIGTFSIWNETLSACIATFTSDAVELAPGRAVFRFELPKLPLIAGMYQLRGGLLDPKTYFLRATHGYENPASPIIVTGPEDRISLLKRNAGQLVAIASDWSVSQACR